MNDKFRRAIKLGIIDEDYKDYLAVEKIPHDFSEIRTKNGRADKN